ncbi:hypothetical protein B0H67DRAFT_650204 [Lasiosphaeris hirsuta]|uniref:Uncharacterized protein n=1 Tax=Lasiosphaeris hirsuta TaxID=260670 RepID=A0AA39ZR34_9PEZI|nr:hypothetical protein B0H67DRAFT_650204 [Lasiosphaeris hirsuta]
MGRIKTIGVGAAWAIVGAALQYSAQNKDWLFIAIEFTLNIFGVVVAYWLEYGLSIIDNAIRLSDGDSPWTFATWPTKNSYLDMFFETFPLQVRAKGNAWGVVGWRIGNRWLTLLCPVMFNAIGENTLHIFEAANFLSLLVVWALYPESK